MCPGAGSLSPFHPEQVQQTALALPALRLHCLHPSIQERPETEGWVWQKSTKNWPSPPGLVGTVLNKCPKKTNKQKRSRNSFVDLGVHKGFHSRWIYVCEAGNLYLKKVRLHIKLLTLFFKSFLFPGPKQPGD